MQKNWIGKPSRAEINFKVNDIDKSIKIFTTRPDTYLWSNVCCIICKSSFIKYCLTEAEIEKIKHKFDKIDNEKEKVEYL